MARGVSQQRRGRELDHYPHPLAIERQRDGLGRAVAPNQRRLRRAIARSCDEWEQQQRDGEEWPHGA
jgi:hypothetical protein